MPNNERWSNWGSIGQRKPIRQRITHEDVQAALAAFNGKIRKLPPTVVLDNRKVLPRFNLFSAGHRNSEWLDDGDERLAAGMEEVEELDLQ